MLGRHFKAQDNSFIDCSIAQGVAVRTVPSYPSIGLGREAEGGLVLAGEECQGARRGLVERGGDDT